MFPIAVLRLRQDIDAPTLAELINALVGETTQMRTSAQSLHEEMGASTAEVGRLREQLEKAQGEALVDPLTELHNRRAFEQAMVRVPGSAAEDRSPCSLLMADIDHFKRINDTYGHVFGDKVIRYVAQRISLSIKGRDVAARYGGEEFAMLLPETTVQGAMVLAEQIRMTVARGKIHRAGQAEPIGGVTISIGVAESVPGDTIEGLVQRADEALYKSKEGGRNQVTSAAPLVIRRGACCAARPSRQERSAPDPMRKAYFGSVPGRGSAMGKLFASLDGGAGGTGAAAAVPLAGADAGDELPPVLVEIAARNRVAVLSLVLTSPLMMSDAVTPSFL